MNIPKDGGTDPFCRYKRRVLDLQYSNRYGGITVLSSDDMEKLGKEIYRDPQHIIDYLKTSLKAQITKTKSSPKEYQIRGKFSSEMIDDIIEEYIVDNVLCSLCGNPETVKSRRKDCYRCKACGAKTLQNKFKF